jgi:hypothetical protein
MVATKTSGVVHYLSSDHLGSTSVSHNTSTGTAWHCLWSGTLSIDDGERSARNFLTLHETGVSPYLRDHRADIQNNAVGIQIGSSVDSRAGVRVGCLEALDAGRLSLEDRGYSNE